MRILVLCEYASLNGGERSFLEAARRVDTTELHFTVAAPSTGPLVDAVHACGFDHLPLRFADRRGYRRPRAELHAIIERLVNESRADLMHANSLAMGRLSGPVAARLGVPSLAHLRDILRLSRAAVGDLNRHQRLLAVSDATRRWYVAAGLSESKVAVAYNGVDLRRFHPRGEQRKLHRELQITDDTPIVGSIGQLGVRKGVDLFVAAARQLATANRHVHFVYVGRRYSTKQEAIEYEQQVRHAATQGNLNGRFHFLGVRDDVAQLLGELAIYVHAARQEPLGRVLLEAGASARPIIATDVGGTREIFPETSRAAILTDANDAGQLACAMTNLLGDSELRRTLGENARRRVAASFDAQQTAAELARWYRVIGGSDSDRSSASAEDSHR
jgi:glycosyltransferase involved in cell wall biosynthesis